MVEGEIGAGVMLGRMNGKRRRSRPRTTWLDAVKDIWDAKYEIQKAKSYQE